MEICEACGEILPCHCQPLVIDYCDECRGYRNLPLTSPLACTCETGEDHGDPYDHDPATLCPGELPTKVHTIHLPEG